MDTGEVDKVKIETGLASSGDDKEWNEGQRHRAVPNQATDRQSEKEVEAMEELFVVDVLHLAHPTELIYPKDNLLFGL
jgi:hypothetical protein